MRIIAFIEDGEVIEKILKHLGLWEVKASPPPPVGDFLRDKHNLPVPSHFWGF